MPADLAAAPTPMISFVICSIDAAKFAAVSSSLAEAVGGEPHEIVGVHDARSLCEGWARGLMRSRGDPVVFCHDDIEVCVRGLASRLARHLRDHDVVGVAGTDTCVGMEWSEAGIEHAYGAIVHDRGAASELCFYGAGAGTDTRVDTGVDTGVDTDVVGGIQAMDGVFLAARRPVAQAIGFDADTFDGWHGYDADFTFRAHLAGHRLAVALDLPIAHRSMGRSDEA
ncbi:MAG TPA: glycosyltransferase, partial [Casimicrobiaceae bacterium]